MVDLRFGHAVGLKNHHKMKAKRSSCSSGGFITSPEAGQEIDTSNEVMFAWDSSCLDITAADLYLYAPYRDSSLVQMFKNVDFTKGSYNTTLKPKWWNSSSSVELELTIVETGTYAFLATLPPGPVWTANYDSTKQTDSSDVGTTSTTDSNVTTVNNLETGKSGLTKGQLAAAVLLPLIAVGLALAAYIVISRKREKGRRKRWSEALDKRMSVISGDWRSMSYRGAEAAIRASMADPNRSSIWSAGAGAGAAGVGVPHPNAPEQEAVVTPEMAQIRRPGVGLRGPLPSSAAGGDGAARVSRISFAADTRFSRASGGEGLGSRGRPSTDSRRPNVPSRAFHSTYIPPVPSRLSEYVPEVDVNNLDSDENGSGMMSPTQRAGPLDLSTEDINARISHETAGMSSLVDSMQPALAMMNSYNNETLERVSPVSHQQQEYQQQEYQEYQEYQGGQQQQLYTLPPLQTSITFPTPVKSPIMESMPMEQPLSAATMMMSPDDMLRAYAERRRTGGGVMSPPGSPAPTMSMPIPVPAPAPASTMMPATMSMPVPVTVPAPAATGSPVSSQMRVLYAPSSTSTPMNEVGARRSSGSLSSRSGSRSGSVTGSDNNPFRKSMAGKSVDTQCADEDAHFGDAS
ncbi:hypothetical protein PNOK_0938200 [Pyrrhoderma noxium]|uniref:Uncharacterized protein n=1 Tax=Pyrrhoderma noxium TaxID=2282107 RepID=A0A286U5N5_9AGAM|nr:hypothetical protein PNOK_0938200 [Pyrrhoderma noxium]